MGLHAYAVQQALFIQGLAHIINAVTLVIPVLVIIIVVQITALRRILSCIGKGFFYKAVASINLYPGRLAVAVARLSCTAVISSTIRIIADALIRHVICIQIQIRILCLDGIE